MCAIKILCVRVIQIYRCTQWTVNKVQFNASKNLLPIAHKGVYKHTPYFNSRCIYITLLLIISPKFLLFIGKIISNVWICLFIFASGSVVHEARPSFQLQGSVFVLSS